MNERILSPQLLKLVQAAGPGYSQANPEWVKKFAELIVRECMTIAKNWEDQLENANSPSESNAVGIVAYRIARQFGVKE